MVSVIIPNYNHASYLKKRIESVLNQTYQDIEVILLDDCSPDNSRDIIEQYRNHPKVSHIVFNEENSGTTFKQWRKGIDLAQGEYIWIAESDDIADIYFLEKIMDSILSNNSSVCFSQSKIIDENSNITGEKPAVLDGNVVECDKFLEEYLLYGNSIYNASMAVFRKDIIPYSIWSDIAKLKYCGDWLFWAEIIAKSKSAVSEVKEPLNFFRMHSSNVSGRSEVKGLTFLEGFPISKKIATGLGFKTFGEFNRKWFEKWYSYRHYYVLSKRVNFKILLMFLRNQPEIAIFEFKRLFSRTFKR